MALYVASGLALLAYTIASAAGLAPWLSLPLQFGDVPPMEAGWMVQTGLTVLVLGLVAYLPGNKRILRLETSHRRFAMNMQDVARAYDAVHRADREGVFAMKSEFDAVRERMTYLRNHPDLGGLETDLLEVASQMGSISHELAESYSDEKVDRARAFLTQRQQEVKQMEERLEEAKIIANDMHNWAMRVELEEDVARSEIQRLQEMLFEVMPELDDANKPDIRETSRMANGRMIELANRQAAE
ncbi:MULTISPECIES: DNA repair protein [unclassified Marinovum]